MLGFQIHAAVVIAALLTLLPFLCAAFWPLKRCRLDSALPAAVRIVRPAVLCVPYAMVAISYGQFRWGWFALYLLLPVVISWLLYRAGVADPAQRGDWRDFLVLAVLGLAVDLRWFEPAWPPHLAVFNKMLLLDAGIYGFLAVRRLEGVGFDLRLRLSDLRIGGRELAIYAPIAIVLGLCAWLSPPPRLYSHGVSRRVGMDLYVFLYCGSRGAFLSRVDAEPAGATPWATLGAVDDGCSLRALALQQARGALQLAICRACCAGGDLLWTGVASGAQGGGVGCYACVRRYALVALAAMM